MSIGRGNSVGRARVGMRRVDFESLGDLGVMETVAVDDDGDAVHGRRVEFGVADLVRRAVRTHQVNVVAVTGVGVTASDAEVGDNDGTVGALESAATVVDFDLSGRFLVAAVAELASFVEVGAFLLRSAGGVARAGYGRRRLENRSGRTIIDGSGPTVGGGELLRRGVPGWGLGWAPAIVVGELLGGGVPHGLVRSGGSLVEDARDDGAVDRPSGGGGGHSRARVEGRNGQVGRGGAGGGRSRGSCRWGRGDGSVGVGSRVGHGAGLGGKYWLEMKAMQTLGECGLCAK